MFTHALLLWAMTPRILSVGYEVWEKSQIYMDANTIHRKQKNRPHKYDCAGILEAGFRY